MVTDPGHSLLLESCRKTQECPNPAFSVTSRSPQVSREICILTTLRNDEGSESSVKAAGAPS